KKSPTGVVHLCEHCRDRTQQAAAGFADFGNKTELLAAGASINSLMENEINNLASKQQKHSSGQADLHDEKSKYGEQRAEQKGVPVSACCRSGGKSLPDVR
ncbi:hypothetical protein COCON_G00172980, partial [Conger conger]